MGAAANNGDSDGGSESSSPSSVTPPPVAGKGAFFRLAPGDVAHSMIAWRTGRRDGTTQMPPIATHLVDLNDINLLDCWVAALSP